VNLTSGSASPGSPGWFPWRSSWLLVAPPPRRRLPGAPIVTGTPGSGAAGAGLPAGDVDLPSGPDQALLNHYRLGGLAMVGARLFTAARGPGHALVRRFGPRLGLTAARQARAVGLIERRGWPALALGRATPGLRTLTVVAAGGSGLSPRRALPALIAGSSAFLQLHLFLGYFLGAAARHVLQVATGPALAAAGVLVLGAVAFWLVRRGRRAGTASLAEAACPACLALALLAEQPAEVRAVVDENVVPGPALEQG